MQKKKRSARRISKAKTARPAKKQLSPATIQKLHTLAEQIGRIVPATSHAHGASAFRRLQKKFGLSKYWPRHGAKKEFIVYRIFRENIAQGIKRRPGGSSSVPPMPPAGFHPR